MVNNYIIRDARRHDCEEIRRLRQELADFEKAPKEVKISAESLEKDGFDSDHPPFHCIVVEDLETPSTLIAYALFFIGYATWRGKKMFLEDIYVTESHRKLGLGSTLITRVCQDAIKLECKAINFVVLDWNPAAEFYKKIGAEDLSEKMGWRYYCLKESSILEIANK